jgi:hypothetical protein
LFERKKLRKVNQKKKRTVQSKSTVCQQLALSAGSGKRIIHLKGGADVPAKKKVAKKKVAKKVAKKRK